MSSPTHLRRRPPPTPTTTSPSSWENVFIRSLVVAGTCQHHRPRERQQRRFNSTSSNKGVRITREEYNNLVDIYPSFVHSNDEPPPPKQQQHYPLASRLTLTPAQESSSSPYQPLPPESPSHALQIEQLSSLLRQPLGRISHTHLWETYLSLPFPHLRPAYLSLPTLHRLFRHLSWTEFKSSPDAMHRYFALLNSVLTCSIPLTSSIWNSAVSFAGRWLRRVSAREVKAAVETWMRMEESGIAATEVTFNILYDLAVRAGRFALAGTIEKELRSRNLPLNRYFRTSVIYHAGMRRDGEGVRRAFRELVDAGEIVDTAVMNCVLLSLLRAGESGAAKSVFLRMKALHESKFGKDSHGDDWVKNKKLGAFLDKEARRLRKEEGVHERSFFGGRFSFGTRREDVQRSSPIAPDGRTYRILIGWAVEVGELENARGLVGEMREKGVSVYGSVWVGLLKGFEKHGGFAGGEWTAGALESVWGEVLESLEERHEEHGYEHDDDGESPPIPLAETARPTYFTPTLALAAVRAFYKCMGRQRMLEVWGVVEERWIEQGASEDEIESVRFVVGRMRSPGEEADGG